MHIIWWIWSTQLFCFEIIIQYLSYVNYRTYLIFLIFIQQSLQLQAFQYLTQRLLHKLLKCLFKLNVLFSIGMTLMEISKWFVTGEVGVFAIWFFFFKISQYLKPSYTVCISYLCESSPDHVTYYPFPQTKCPSRTSLSWLGNLDCLVTTKIKLTLLPDESGKVVD